VHGPSQDPPTWEAIIGGPLPPPTWVEGRGPGGHRPSNSPANLGGDHRSPALQEGAWNFTLPFYFQNQPCPIFGQGRQILNLVYISQPALPKVQKKPLG
jgi:hypothetical protein